MGTVGIYISNIILYSLVPLFPCSHFLKHIKCGGGGGNIFLAFYAIPSFLEQINYGNKKINIFLFYRKTIVDRDSGNLYPIYI